jgi:predicted MFS family arabinose efflux permease
MSPQLNKRALHRSFWGSLSRLIGVGLGAGAGSLIYNLVGGGFHGWGVAAGLAVVSFVLMWISEYEKERH